MQTTHQFNSIHEAKQFALAGNAILTLQSLKTGVHFTYRVKAATDKETGEVQPGRWFVSLLTQGSADEGTFHYLGMIRDSNFMATRATNGRENSPSFKAFSFFFHASVLHPELRVMHEGRCGRCGRTLTVPSSIQAGIGPECALKMES